MLACESLMPNYKPTANSGPDLHHVQGEKVQLVENFD